MISAVAAANPDSVVVLMTGKPVAMPWSDRVKAIVQAWYPTVRRSPTILVVAYRNRADVRDCGLRCCFKRRSPRAFNNV